MNKQRNTVILHDSLGRWSFLSSKTGGLLGALMVLADVIYSLAVFDMSKNPYLTVRLLPDSATAVMLGLLAGLLCFRYRRLY